MSFVDAVPLADFPAELAYTIESADGAHERTLDIFHKLAHSAPVFNSFTDATAATLTQLKLDPQLRELVICKVTLLNEADYPHHRHVILSRALGVADDRLLALPVFEKHPIFDDREKAALQFTTELVRNRRVTDATKNAVAAYFDQRERVELTWVVGFYQAVSMFTSACEVAIEPDGPMGVPTPKPR